MGCMGQRRALTSFSSLSARSALRAAWLLPLFGWLAGAQPLPAPNGPAPTFRTGAELVQVSVIAQDQQGHPVRDLKQEDFTLLDDGKPQAIRLFLTEAEPPTLTPPPAPRAPNVFTNQIATGPRGEYSAILFDNLHTDAAHTARSREKAIQALRTVPAGDKVALYSLWCKFQVIREFTSDRDSLLRQLASFAPAAASCSGGADDPETEAMTSSKELNRLVPEAAIARAHADADFNYVGVTRSFSFSDQEIEQMADHLAGIPGRKNLIWIATTFFVNPAALQKLMNAGVAVYPVDAYGSMIGTRAEKEARAAMLRGLAAMTGGVAYVDRDDLDAAVRDAIEDGRSSYTLGFYQSGQDAESKLHQLAVRVNRPGVTLRYRTSYQSDVPKASPAPVPELIQALDRPVNSTAIPIQAQLTRTKDTLKVVALLEESSLDLVPQGGLWTGKLECLTRFMTAEGKLIGGDQPKTITLNLRQATYNTAMQHGLPYVVEMKIPPGAVELRLLFSNLATGKTGTLAVPLSELQSTVAAAK